MLKDIRFNKSRYAGKKYNHVLGIVNALAKTNDRLIFDGVPKKNV